MTARRPGRERGSGSVLVVGILGALLGLTVLLAPVLRAHVDTRVAATAADAAALAAADTLVGIVPGDPCSNADRTARANASSLVSCAVDGVTVIVQVTRTSGPFTATATARAGPPGTPTP